MGDDGDVVEEDEEEEEMVSEKGVTFSLTKSSLISHNTKSEK